MRNDTAIMGDRWQALEEAFNDLEDTDTPIGGCDDVQLQGESRFLVQVSNIDPLEGSSNFSLVSRLIAGVTSPEEVGSRARALLKQYQNLEGLVRAATSDIKQDEILTDMERSVLRTVRDVSRSFLRETSSHYQKIASFSDLKRYLRVSLAAEHAEVTRLIMLDRQYNIIADELHCFGKLNQTQIFPKKVVARTVAHDAASIIIVHSHPSGEPDPTRDDIRLTRRLAFVLEELGVILYDHVIVGRRMVASLRRLGALSEGG